MLKGLQGCWPNRKAKGLAPSHQTLVVLKANEEDFHAPGNAGKSGFRPTNVKRQRNCNGFCFFYAHGVDVGVWLQGLVNASAEFKKVYTEERTFIVVETIEKQ